jgi:hypothetical protein
MIFPRQLLEYRLPYREDAVSWASRIAACHYTQEAREIMGDQES